MDMSAYTYKPLPVAGRHIRVCRLLPPREEGDETIAVTVHVVNLDSRPQYSALSYVWGDPADKSPITVDGKQLYVCSSLVSFLHQLRAFWTLEQRKKVSIGRLSKRLLRALHLRDHRDQYFTFWADAISINQSDPVEKSRQVPLMKDIYENSHRVTAWLGSKTDKTDMAMSLVEELAGNKRLEKLNYWISRPDLTEEPLWDSLSDLCERPFWNRVWILQEFILAPKLDIMWGERLISIETLHKAEQLLFRMSVLREDSDDFRRALPLHVINSSLINASVFIQHRHAYWDNGEKGLGNHFQTLLLLGRLRASDPRDKIYAILGVTRHDIVADYTKSTRDVYVQYAKDGFARGFGLQILDHAGSGIMDRADASAADLPSWVCDWNALTNPRVRVIPQLGASTRRRPDISAFRLDTESDTLWMKAVNCDRIAKVHRFEDNILAEPEFWADWVSRQQPPYPTGIPRLLALFLTLLKEVDAKTGFKVLQEPVSFYSLADGFLSILLLIAPDETETESSTHIYSLERWARADFDPAARGVDMPMIEELFLGDKAPSLNRAEFVAERGPRDERSLMLRFLDQAVYNIQHRAFAWTTDGYFGIVPRWCAAGDIVCKIPDTELLFVLREKEHHHWEFVGSCSILGFNKDDSPPIPQGERRDVREFAIR